MRRFCLLATLAMAPAAWAQESAVVVDRGPGGSGRALESVLAQPHRLIASDSGWYRLRRGEHAAASLVVLQRSAAIEGNVNGDVVVVGGDLFIRPGARVGGRAVAIGGGVYPSALAVVEQGTASYRDNTFTVERVGNEYRLAYLSLRVHASPPLLFPGVYGLRMPAYDRVNGLSLPFGPALSALGERAEFHALVTYRTDLGKIDPSIHGALHMTRRLRAEAYAGRGTFSNDTWIRSNFVNSFNTLILGSDTRNYFRADRGVLTLHRLWEWAQVQIEPFAGAQIEESWSVGPAPGEARGPWSLFGRTDSLGMYRPNPPIESGQIAAALFGLRLLYDTDDLRVALRSRGEANGSAPSGQRFVQVTSDLDLGFPTFREQEYGLEVHWMTTAGDIPPPQRFGYLGGSGTIPFLDLLEQGGDEVFLIDQRYTIPVPRVRVGLLGEPTLVFRHRLGSAGVGRLPAFEQVLGAGVMLTLVRAELQVDPARGQLYFSAGFSFSR